MMAENSHAAHYSPGERRWRLGLTALLALYGWLCMQSPGDYRWLDSLDLAIHETGHLIFAFDGETLGILGGTLLQLIVPALFAVALWRSGDRHGATVPLWWMGQNCWNISVYIKDARAQQLPLVGGGEHDWVSCWENGGCSPETGRSAAPSTSRVSCSTVRPSSAAGCWSAGTGPCRCHAAPPGPSGAGSSIRGRPQYWRVTFPV